MSVDQDRIEATEARVTALAALMRGVLTSLVLRGTLTGASIEEMLRETEGILRERGAHAAALGELKALRTDLPDYLRAAMGPGPDPDFEDH